MSVKERLDENFWVSMSAIAPEEFKDIETMIVAGVVILTAIIMGGFYFILWGTLSQPTRLAWGSNYYTSTQPTEPTLGEILLIAGPITVVATVVIYCLIVIVTAYRNLNRGGTKIFVYDSRCDIFLSDRYRFVLEDDIDQRNIRDIVSRLHERAVAIHASGDRGRGLIKTTIEQIKLKQSPEKPL